MTIKQLAKKRKAIPPDNPVNRARRAEIMAMINRGGSP